MNDLHVDTYDLLSGFVPERVIGVVVKFGEEIPSEMQGVALLAFEKHLRSLTGMDCRVFKDKMGDDSKLRIRMTQAERDKL